MADAGARRPPLAALVLHDAAMAFARLYWFLAFSDGELGPSFLAAADLAGALGGLQRHRVGPSRDSLPLRVVALGWAMASWTRASLTLQGRLPVCSRRRGTASEDDARAIALAELLGAWLLLRVAGRLIGRPKPRPRAWHAPAVLLSLFLIDELLHHVLLRALLGPAPRPFAVRGRATAGKDEDCCICQGTSPFEQDDSDAEKDPRELDVVGFGTLRSVSRSLGRTFFDYWDEDEEEEPEEAQGTPSDSDSDAVLPGSFPTEPGESAASSTTTDLASDIAAEHGLRRTSSTTQVLSALSTFPVPPVKTSDPVECFCRRPQHLAHRHCMAHWIRTSRRRQCPMCRAPLLVHLEPLPGKQTDVIDWTMMATRGAVSAACVGGLAVAALARRWFDQWWRNRRTIKSS